jgi:hypothetical protein
MRLADYLQEGLQTNDPGAMKMAANALGTRTHARTHAPIADSLFYAPPPQSCAQVGWPRPAAP